MAQNLVNSSNRRQIARVQTSNTALMQKGKWVKFLQPVWPGTVVDLRAGRSKLFSPPSWWEFRTSSVNVPKPGQRWLWVRFVGPQDDEDSLDDANTGSQAEQLMQGEPGASAGYLEREDEGKDPSDTD